MGVEAVRSLLHAVVALKLLALPEWALAVMDWVSAGFFVTYWNSQWERWARPFAVTMALGTAFWVTLAGWIGAPTPRAAAVWFRGWVAVSMPLEWAVTDAMVVLLDLPPKWRLGWGWTAAGTAWVAAATLFAHPPLLLANAAGFWVVPPPGSGAGAWLTVAEAWPLVWVGLFVARLLRRPVPRRIRAYSLAMVGALAAVWNDGRFPGHGLAPFPTLWVAGLLWLLILWVEIKSHIEKTYHQLRFDGMTGALSRSWGELYLQRLLQDHSLGAIYGDIDYFKQINDRHGHLVGDLVLRDLVARIRPVIRREDVVVRLSGDEFLVAFPDVSPTHGPELLARVEEALVAPPFWVPAGDPEHPEPVAVSLGWAWSPAGGSLTELVRAADRAMYETKARHHARWEQA
ncbi:MAG: GGDEF domain-containing protein [Firmicutes bacterium]|nr:GGDEF domain-containing protein [Alicyclobacillaceae bacterium]MCL6498239.1 GGDEF domain-containing protein [Bacillota bacterium]